MAEPVEAWCAKLLGETVGSTAAEQPAVSMRDLPSVTIDDLEDSPMRSTSRPSCSSQAPVDPLDLGVPLSAAQVLGPSRDPAVEAKPTEEESGSGIKDYIASDTVYRHWVPKISKPLTALVRLRGPFKRKVVCGSFFEGTGSERHMLKIFDVPTDWIFGCECKESAVAFSQHHFPPSEHEHLFTDARDFINGMKGECYNHDFAICSLEDIAPYVVDILFITHSCRPYTKARKGRSQGVTEHEDYYHMEIFLNVFRKVRPKAFVYEQVFGFTLAESTEDSESPMNKLLKKLCEEFPGYHIATFAVQGNVFLI